MKVSIILPCYNSGEHLKYAIESIINNTKHPYELILVESESTDGTDKVCDEFAKRDNIRVFHTKKEGITKAINFAIDQTDNDVYLTQDDVILPNLYGRDWLETLVNFSKQENCGVVTTINAGGVSGREYLNGFRWVGTWSLYIPRKTINKIGKLDELFSPGPGDDVDYSYRIVKAGLEIIQANFWVDHHRMTENFNDQPILCMRGAKKFREKHNIKPFWEEVKINDKIYFLDERTLNKEHAIINSSGNYNDQETMTEIENLTKDMNGIFLDVGAQLGMMSLVSNIPSIAIEPNLEIQEIIINNLYINSKNYRIIPLPASDRVFNYEFIKKEPTGTSTIKETDDTTKPKTFLLDILKDMPISLIKIDVESQDPQVIKGAKELIKLHKPKIIVETADEELFKELNYKKTKALGINQLWES